MSTTAGLTSIPPEIYETMRRSGAFQPNSDALPRPFAWHEFPNTYIDRAWRSLHRAFSHAGPPLSQAIQGDYYPDGGIDRWLNKHPVEAYLAYVSPTGVKGISRALPEFPVRENLTKLPADDAEIAYCLPYYVELVGLYGKASHRGDAVFISIS